jgi:predicted amidohydrolase
MLVDPHGTVVIDAGAEETWIHAAVDPALVAEWRAAFPPVRDYLASILSAPSAVKDH